MSRPCANNSGFPGWTSTAEFAGLFPDARLVVQPGAGHYPWLDDADRYVATTVAFLGR
jgi:proline iminopeptidase